MSEAGDRADLVVRAGELFLTPTTGTFGREGLVPYHYSTIEPTLLGQVYENQP